MKIYKVTFSEVFEIEAYSEVEALEQAQELMSESDADLESEVEEIVEN